MEHRHLILTTAGEMVERTKENPTLRYWQNIVDGYIEAVNHPERETAFFCNEEAKLKGFGMNPVASAWAWANGYTDEAAGDYVAGDIVFIGGADSEGETTSISDDEYQRLVHELVALGGRPIGVISGL